MSIKINPEVAALFTVLNKKQITALGDEMVAKFEAWQAETQAAKVLAEKMDEFTREFQILASKSFDDSAHEADVMAVKFLANRYGVGLAKTAKNPDTLGDSWAGKLPLPEKIEEIVNRLGRTVSLEEAEVAEGLSRKTAAIVSLESAWKYERDLFRGQLGEVYSRLGLPSKPVESIGNRAVELRRQYAAENAVA